MLNPNDPPELQLQKQAKIIGALMNRMERTNDLSSTPFSLFQSAIELQSENWEKSRNLDDVLVKLRKINDELESANVKQEQGESYLTDLLETMQEGYALFSEGKLLIFNNRFKNLLPDVSKHVKTGVGFKKYVNAVADSSHLKFVDEDDRKAWNELRWNQHGKNLSSFLLELENDHWVRISDRRTHEGNIAIVQTDVTDDVLLKRQESRRILSEQAELLQAVFDHLNLGIGTFTAAGDLMVHNSDFAELMKLPEDLLVKGTNIYTIFEYLGDNSVFEKYILSTITETFFDKIEELDIFQWQVDRFDGVAMDLCIQRLPNGEFIASLMDKTNEQTTADQLRRINENLDSQIKLHTKELTRTNKLLQDRFAEAVRVQRELQLAKEAAEKADRSKTRFLAAASHDLLQPINAAKLYISQLADNKLDKSGRDTVKRLDQSFTTIEILLRDLLDISRLDSNKANLNIENFPINEILEPLESDFSQLAKEKSLKLRIVKSKLIVRSDLHFLRRIMQNLVSNAIKFTPQGQVLVGGRRRNGLLVLEVWDTGIGVSKKDQKIIFEEFTRLDQIDIEKGMGLGLSIVEHACRHLNHEVNLRSKTGVGSVFSVEIPFVGRSSDADVETEQMIADNVNMLDLIVMIVENDLDVLHATTKTLESWGASVLAVTSTNEALKQLTELGMPPDILLVDYQLDGNDNGINSILQVRQQSDKDIPAIMITANQSKLLAASSHDHDFAILAKPVALPKLRSLIEWKIGKSSG